MPAERWRAPLLCLLGGAGWLLWLVLRAFPSFPAVQEVEIAEARGERAQATGPWQTTALPLSTCSTDCRARWHLIRHRFHVANQPATDQAVFLPLYVANLHVQLDGIPLDQRGRLHPVPDAYAYHARLVRLPAAALTPGPHELLIHLASDAPPRGGLGRIWIGAYATLRPAQQARDWLTRDLVVGVVWALVCSIVMAAVVLRRRRDESLLLSFLLSAPFWCLLALLQVAPEWLPADALRLRLVFVAQFGCMATTPLFLLSLLEAPSARLRRVLLSAGALAIALALSSLWWGRDSPYRSPVIPAQWTAPLGYLLIGLRLTSLVVLPWMLWLVWRIARSRPSSRSAPWLVLCAALPALGATIDLLFGAFLPPIQIPLLPLGGIGLALALWLELGRRIRGYEQQLAGHAESLAATVRERERELEASFERLRATDRERALLAERQRLLRDMHDGVGGQLASLVHLAADPRTERARVVEGLREGLADLRLILDSLAQQEDDLLLAFGRLRHRIEPTLKSAGIQLNWDIDPGLELPPWPPEAVLHLYRLVQEATHNCIRHAGAQTLRISLRARDGGLWLEISDDGGGLPAPADRRGYGLAGMQARAQALGARFELDCPAAGGTTVRLLFPTLVPPALPPPRG